MNEFWRNATDEEKREVAERAAEILNENYNDSP